MTACNAKSKPTKCSLGGGGSAAIHDTSEEYLSEEDSMSLLKSNFLSSIDWILETFDAQGSVSTPGKDASVPKWDKPNAYSWAKAPRYNGEIVEVGALGRQLISGDPLVSELFPMKSQPTYEDLLRKVEEQEVQEQVFRSTIQQVENIYYVKNKGPFPRV